MSKNRRSMWRTLLLTAACLATIATPSAMADHDPPPGLYNNDGSPRPIHSLPKPTNTIDIVADYGADPADNGSDDAAIIRQAIADAQPGDEIFFPEGTYNLNTAHPNDAKTHLLMKSGVYLRGESQVGVVLKSNFDNVANSAVIRGRDVFDVLLTNFTVTSTWDRNYPVGTQTNPDAGGPDFGVHFLYGTTSTYNITVDRLIVEKYKKHGFSFANTRDVVLQNSLFRNATNNGGGGMGYGINIRGTMKIDKNGLPDDSAYHVVQNNTFQGPHLRHGVLLMSYTHNNVIRNNTIATTKLAGIDMHGQDEYLNEVYGNTISGQLGPGAGGGGISLGHLGGTHDATGRKNYIHDNEISQFNRTNTAARQVGIDVMYGTPDTLIERNTIHTAIGSPGAGIYLGHAPRTIIRGNVVTGLTGADAWGIYLAGDDGVNDSPPGNPDDSELYNNTITHNSGGLKLEAGSGIKRAGNTVSDNGVNYDYSVPVTTIPIDRVAPVAPTGLAATSVTDARVQLTWDAVPDSSVNGYLIYNGAQVVGSTAGQTDFEVVNLLPDTSYAFTVRAKDDGAHLSPPSAVLTVTTDDGVEPVSGIEVAAPLTTVATGTSMRLQAHVEPAAATNPSVTWSVTGGNGEATELASIDPDGQLTLHAAGEVRATATANDGSGVTGSIAIQAVPPLATGAPARAVLSDNSGHGTGLRDGSYSLTMNMWWGNNGSVYRLYEDGALIDTRVLADESPHAQAVSVDITGRKNGTYTYTCELSNGFGTTVCEPHHVTITDAEPGRPVLEHDNWDGDHSYAIAMNMWWGTNGTIYRLYEDDILIDTQELGDDTPTGQQAVTEIYGKPSGSFEYRAELENAAGITASDTITVQVTDGAAQPEPGVVLLEFEDMVVSGSWPEGQYEIVHDPNLSGGAGVRLYGEQVQDYIQFVPHMEAGPQLIELGVRKGPDQGIVQLWTLGGDLGQPIDLYAASEGAAVIDDLPMISPGVAGDKILRFTLIGQHEESAGLALTIDYIKLTMQQPE
ncbi:right-handed parallel beta-helix repeat-containing protein [Paenibacillus sp. IB182496]|uniref:Right-handed parallel beta-helix repeat-containing protein n=1 Tax=Paenibacillus sabuli TaxID=2772509 RepID=A0A927BPK9_9BACL|nr:right-handed parallel beta-helix repeat-containing protein [Paenibacillus sabuli]MBD2844392.1 right-handed parallel beta-helix repeat-containing protein [Paenibacillus sabuli]